jgi:trk system potassium uptake protein TrkA
MSLPIDAALPEAQLKQARAALARAKAVGEEYEGVEVATATVRARRAGQAIVDEAKRRGVQAVVLAAEEPSKIRGGALLGGRGGPLDDFVGEATEVRAGQGAVPGHPHRAACLRPRRSPPTSPPTRPATAPCRAATALLGRVRANAPHTHRRRRPRRVLGGALDAGRGERGVDPDEDPLSHERLDSGMDTTWEDSGGRFTVGHGLEIDALIEAGIEEADVFIASTDGDNTNLTIAQIASKQFGVPKVVARVMDPRRAEWYAEQGPAHDLPHALRDRDVRARAGGLAMYVVIAGAGKVGWNLARELIAKGHEVTVIESERSRYLTVEQELEHAIQYGDATELWVLERAGINRADLTIAVTGDDEDNLLICQIAKEKYLCSRIIARVNNPATARTSSCSASSRGQRHRPDPAPHRARGPVVRPRPPARPARRAARDHRGRGRSGRPGRRVQGGRGRAARRLADHLRAAQRQGFVPKADTVIDAGDEVLLVLDPASRSASPRSSRAPADPQPTRMGRLRSPTTSL